MPDQQKLTVSATQVPMLLGCSPYGTPWTLYQHFANGHALPVEVNDRMEWGNKLQPLVLQQAAQDLKLEVEPCETYVRRGPVGCTRDAQVYCPDRGPGALEVKCVFDYRTWMQEWGGGSFVPRHIARFNSRHLVGTGENATIDTSFQWGVIAVWVAATMYYFEPQACRGVARYYQGRGRPRS